MLNISSIVGSIGRIFPAYGVTKSTMVFAHLSSGNNRCNSFDQELQSITCNKIIMRNEYISQSDQLLLSCCQLFTTHKLYITFNEYSAMILEY